MVLSELNYVAIFVAAAVTFLLGGLWYSPILFAKAWMREAGLSEAQTRQANMARTFGLSGLAALVMAFNLAAFIGPQATLAFGAFAGFAAGFGWVAMSLGVIYLFEQRSLKLWLINSGYQVLAFTLMGTILGAWK
jgi:membrane-associated HD superfamily phosphohydrolase